MSNKRIQVHADENMRRRLTLAAAKEGVPVHQYCLAAIRERLAQDDLLEDEIEMAGAPAQGEHLMVELTRLHQDILSYRDGELLDIDAELEATREERDEELIGLR